MPKLSITAIKPTTSIVNAPAVIAAAQQATRDEVGDVVKDLQKTTATWKKRPRFTVRVRKDGADVRTDNEIWNMLDEGTRPHMIFPKRAKKLRFQTGYSAKTRPGSLSSKGGGASGPVVFSDGVRHPGTFARRWTEKAQAESAKRYPKRVQANIKKALD